MKHIEGPITLEKNAFQQLHGTVKTSTEKWAVKLLNELVSAQPQSDKSLESLCGNMR